MLALDLFAGARGWSVGGRMAGIEDEGVEIMPEANATAVAAGFKVAHDDVWTFPTALLPRYVGQITSPPCQTFSKMGTGTGRRALDDVLALLPLVDVSDLAGLRRAGERLGDDRTALVLTPLWFALHAPDRTRWLAWEQVPAVLPVWEACAVILRAEGWHVWTGYVQSEQYGVPQTRKRAVLLASKDHVVGRPPATHSLYYAREPWRLDPDVLPWVSMRDVLGPLTPARVHVQANRPAGMNTEWDFEDLFGKPSPTVGGRGLVAFRGDYRLRTRNDGFLISVEDAARLQSFPADYPWVGNTGNRSTVGSKYLQVGNAVPPLMARALLSEAAHGVI